MSDSTEAKLGMNKASSFLSFLPSSLHSSVIHESLTLAYSTQTKLLPSYFLFKPENGDDFFAAFVSSDRNNSFSRMTLKLSLKS